MAVVLSQELYIRKEEKTVNTLLSPLPESPSVTDIVSFILNLPIDLHHLQGSGAEGQSGCSIYFARDRRDAGKTVAVAKVFPPSCHSDYEDEVSSHQTLLSLPEPPAAAGVLGWSKCIDDRTGQWAEVIVYQLAPGQALNTMIRDIGRITTVRYILELAQNDEQRRFDVLEGFFASELRLPLTEHKLGEGKTDHEVLCNMIGRRSDQLMSGLISSVKAVASTLAKLHRIKGEWGDASECVVEKLRDKLRGWVQEIQGPSRDEYMKAIGYERIERLVVLVNRAISESRQEGHASLLHGDASSGNFFWDPIRGITMIDYGGLARSMDCQGNPIGPAEMDVAGFYERLRKYSGQFGMKESDIATVQEEFWKAYQAQGVPLSEGIVQLFRTRTQLSRLWSAVSKLKKSCDERHLAQLRAKVEFEWDYFQNIFPEISPPWRVLFVASTSGPGKGGLPLFNQELVRAMSELPNTSVTLFVVKSEDEKTNLATAHGQAKVVSISSGECNPSSLLYHVAKVHQPDEFCLPATDQQGTTAFDLIIGHSRYSSAAATLIRERWYPAAKLALITHTSPLRKSDVAWKWYGETRELGYVEAARLAMLDEKILPKADLAVGVGPALTAEAREREWMGQCSRRRSIQTGPRFHELVPGAHIYESTQSHRQLDGVFRVLLPGRADDPAKGLDDAIYAVQRVASLGNKIVLHVLGVPINELNSWQNYADQITGTPGLVQFHPFSNDRLTVLRSYRMADLVIMPSTHEGFGMIFTEVAGLGIPILVTQDSGAGQLALDRTRIPVEVGQACVVFDESAYGIKPSPESERVAIWAHRIDHVRRHLDQACKDARALQQVMRGYSWKHAAQALLSAAIESTTDTVQRSNGVIAPMEQSSVPSLSPDVLAAMHRAARTRNRTGAPDPVRAAEVLHSLPEVHPTTTSLEKHVSTALGCPVRLRSMDTTHPQGFSGAVIFFAYTQDCNTKNELPVMPTETSQGRVIAVVKLFVHGLDNGITEELSSLEWLLLQAKGEIRIAAPLAVGKMIWENKLAGVVTYEVAQGMSLYQLMMQLGSTPRGAMRDDILAVLKAGVEEVARTLKRLHSFGLQGKSSANYLEWYFSALAQRVETASLYADILRREGLEVDQLASDMKELATHCQEDMTRNLRTAVVHGDAHPGNFFYDQATGQVTMIDTTTLHSSLDENSEPAGALERDISHFVHMMRRTGEQYGMTDKEMEVCTTVFMDACVENTTVNMQTVRMLMVCSALSFLNRSAREETADLGRQVKIVQDLLCFGKK
ncbi:hypothetical protein DTO195F2_8849 [Paecilomyces variotii]|nr:hypothetical protein DTO195F2_8849 [Paecilomyces variotii]